ncbi:MAG: hypothetical protein BWX80_02414 [Candidatus Hydrogenedentes bacterium ADurb.Bin101]|nr:MAG: hypothetical protein BWX80_02414 [Candidatus Hydrogenedentes bacterium ADurb.Bin101]
MRLPLLYSVSFRKRITECRNESILKPISFFCYYLYQPKTFRIISLIYCPRNAVKTIFEMFSKSYQQNRYSERCVSVPKCPIICCREGKRRPKFYCDVFFVKSNMPVMGPFYYEKTAIHFYQVFYKIRYAGNV